MSQPWWWLQGLAVRKRWRCSTWGTAQGEGHPRLCLGAGLPSLLLRSVSVHGSYCLGEHLGFGTGMSSLACFVVSYPHRIRAVGFSPREKEIGAEVRNWGQNSWVWTGSDRMHPWGGSQSSHCLEASARAGRAALVEGVSSSPHAEAMDPQVPGPLPCRQVPGRVLASACTL